MKPLYFPSSHLRQWLPVRVACAALVISLFPVSVQSNPEHAPEAVSPSDPANTEALQDRMDELAMFDRLQADSQRLHGLVQDLSQVSHALSALKPYREAVMILLDRDLPVQERWYRAMSLAPELKQGGTEPVEQSDGTPELEAELVSLRNEVDALRAELSVLDNTPWIPEPSLPEESAEDDWVLGRENIRYVQLPASGTDTEPAVWLASAGEGLRVGVNETVMVGGKRVRLAELRERPGGRIRLLFAVDGEPRTVDW